MMQIIVYVVLIVAGIWIFLYYLPRLFKEDEKTDEKTVNNSEEVKADSELSEPVENSTSKKSKNKK